MLVSRPEIVLAELRVFMRDLGITRLETQVEEPWEQAGPAVATRDAGRFRIGYARSGTAVREGALLSLGEQWAGTLERWRARCGTPAAV